MFIKIAARRSHLARLQAELVGQALKSKNPQLEIEYKWLLSKGDIDLSTPLHKMPDKGVFTADLTDGLINGDFDIVVHSWKDLPVESNPKTQITATLPRADLRDVLLFKKSSIGAKNITISSSSPRREYSCGEFLSSALPWNKKRIRFEAIRGNIPTRVKKFFIEQSDGLILAKAALDRLLTAKDDEAIELQNQLREVLGRCHFMIFPLSVNPAAPAQGALAIETLHERHDLNQLLQSINVMKDFAAVQTERDIFSQYGGGCHQKIGVSVIQKPFGRILYLRGQTESGQTLDEVRNLDRLTSDKVPRSQMFPIEREDSQFFDREMISVDFDLLQAKDIWVAKAIALPESYKPGQNQILWTAGVESWKKLAKRGIWVHGCADGLGENEDPMIDHLLGRKTEFLRLTHDQAENLSANQSLATYKLIQLKNLPDLVGKTHFYWYSYSSFKCAVEAFPHIIDGHHACGPGHTARLIEKTIGRGPEIFVSHKEWLQTYSEIPVRG